MDEGSACASLSTGAEGVGRLSTHIAGFVLFFCLCAVVAIGRFIKFIKKMRDIYEHDIKDGGG